MFINQILTKLKTSVYSKSETETLLNSKGFITSEIDSMGEGWVRFKSGLQICWGFANALMQYGSPMSYWVYPKSFISTPTASCTVDNGGYYWVSIANTRTDSLDFAAYNSAGGGAATLGVRFIVIGRWK